MKKLFNFFINLFRSKQIKPKFNIADRVYYIKLANPLYQDIHNCPICDGIHGDYNCKVCFGTGLVKHVDPNKYTISGKWSVDIIEKVKGKYTYGIAGDLCIPECFVFTKKRDAYKHIKKLQGDYLPLLRKPLGDAQSDAEMKNKQKQP